MLAEEETKQPNSLHMQHIGAARKQTPAAGKPRKALRPTMAVVARQSLLVRRETHASVNEPTEKTSTRQNAD